MLFKGKTKLFIQNLPFYGFSQKCPNFSKIMSGILDPRILTFGTLCFNKVTWCLRGTWGLSTWCLHICVSDRVSIWVLRGMWCLRGTWNQRGIQGWSGLWVCVGIFSKWVFVRVTNRVDTLVWDVRSERDVWFGSYMRFVCLYLDKFKWPSKWVSDRILS